MNIKRMIRNVTAVVLVFAAVLSCASFEVSAASLTGAGMAEWALRAYNEGWEYVYGGSSEGAVDCSGLIRSYIKGGGGAKALLNASPKSGNISNMPNIHGLGLWCEGHAGVYVGKNDNGVNMAVDARNERVDVVYSTMDSRSWNPWVKWFKIKGVTYPTTGWVTYNGKQYYYLDGEFVTGIQTVEGKTYDFGKSGALKGEVDPSKTTTAPPATTTKKPTTTTKKPTTTTTKSASLRQGSSGNDVTKLQKRLIELGYMSGSATGYYGDKTVEAVKKFQRQAGLTADGVAGKGTQTALYADSAPKYTTTTTTKKTTTTTTTTTTKPTTTTTVKPTTTTAKPSTAGTTSVQTNQTSQTTTTTSSPQPTEPTTATTTAPPEIVYKNLDVGSKGDEVTALQIRLAELGYFDQEISGYYGRFTRDAIKAFQAKVIPLPTGIADSETQRMLFAPDAPGAADEVDLALIYGEDYLDLQLDGGDMDAEEEIIEEVPTLMESQGIGSLEKNADLSAFLKDYGNSGALATFGLWSVSEPTVTIYRNGTSYEISEELSRAIDECVFF